MIMMFDVERFWLATLSVLSPRVFLHNMFRALHQPRIVGIAVAAGNRWVASASPSDSPTGGGRKPAFRLPHPAQGLSASPKHLPTGGGGKPAFLQPHLAKGLSAPPKRGFRLLTPWPLLHSGAWTSPARCMEQPPALAPAPTDEMLYNTLKELIVNIPDMEAVTLKHLRQRVAQHLGLGEDGLEGRKQIVSDFATAIIQEKTPPSFDIDGEQVPGDASPEAIQVCRAAMMASMQRSAVFPQPLRQCIADELHHWKSLLLGQRGRDPIFGTSGAWLCPMRPHKQLHNKRRLGDHFRISHERQANGCGPTKQHRLMRELWNRDASASVREALFASGQDVADSRMYLKRSADVIRRGLQQSPSWLGIIEANEPRSASRRSSKLDECTIPLLDNADTRYILRDDSHAYHKIGARLCCTDRFLTSLYAEFIHPDTKGADGRVTERLRIKCGQLGFLVPGMRLLGAVRDSMFTHPMVLAANDRCRHAADTTVLGIDGQYSTLLKVLYQIPFRLFRQQTCSACRRSQGVADRVVVGWHVTHRCLHPGVQHCQPNGRIDTGMWFEGARSHQDDRL